MAAPILFTDPLLEAFDRDGFVVLEDLFTFTEVAEIRRCLDRLEDRAKTLGEITEIDGTQFVVDRAGGDARIHRVVWCGGIEPKLLDFGNDPRLVGLAARLLASPVLVQLINQVHFKLPGDGVAFPWHQDSRHRRHGTPLWTDINGRGSFVEIVVAIDEMTMDNGPLEFIRGSHHGGPLDLDPATGALPSGSFSEAEAVTLTMRPGSAVAFGPYVVHGSKPNASRSGRRAFLNGFALPGANRKMYPGCGVGREVRFDIATNAVRT
jgi:ectoine hydroxylase-related dioxygenase (phytanoyl-CoA dioxygenase family)